MERFKGIIGIPPCGNPVIFLLAVGLLASTVSYTALAENPLGLTTKESIVSVHAGERLLLRYRYRDVPFKPYVEQLFSPGGTNVLRDAPSDHLHHHALMFAVTVDGVNFWEEQQAPGRQVHRSFTNMRIDKPDDLPRASPVRSSCSRRDRECTGVTSNGASFTECIDWTNPRSKELLLKEHRTIEVCQMKEPQVTLLSWQSRFELPPEKKSATLTGAHYHGLGMRFLKSMDVGGQFRNAAGRAGDVVRGDERLVQARWCAYTAKANEKTVTIAMFGHPDNLRHPAQWFTMTKPFAYLSATLNLHKELLKVTSDKPLVLRYAVVLWDNQVGNEQIEKVYNWWVNSK